MADLRKLQRNMSNALETGYSFERNTGFFFRIISSEEKLQLGKNKNKRKKRKCLPISSIRRSGQQFFGAANLACWGNERSLVEMKP